MAGEGRSPSTKRAAISEPIAKAAATAGKTSTQGTGQRTVKITERGAEITRADDRPSKSGSAPKKSTDQDRRVFTQDKPTDLSQRASETVPDVKMPDFVMYRDDAPKSARERAFGTWVSDNKERLTGAQERDLWPTPLERGTQAEIAKGDKYTGSANKVSKPPKQAQ